MKYGFVMPPEDPQATIGYAVAAEEAGWDGFFLSEGMWSSDAWLCLAAAAMRTSRIRLGTLLTPLSIMRPWKLAGEVATLDQLSKGRTILTVGMGAPDVGFAAFGEATDLRTRAELVDEGLDLLDALWSHKPFEHHGKHYQVDARRLRAPVPIPLLVQQPRVPIWVVGAWPRPKSMRRVLRCDGILPWIKPKGTRGRSATPADIREIRTWVDARRKIESPFDIVIEGVLPKEPAAAVEQGDEWSAAGATWFIESLWGEPWEVWERSLHRGPPPLMA